MSELEELKARVKALEEAVAELKKTVEALGWSMDNVRRRVRR